VERKSQKAIVIGKNGALLKQVERLRAAISSA
jgi:GTPase Era involved in 16S rRNA processing